VIGVGAVLVAYAQLVGHRLHELRLHAVSLRESQQLHHSYTHFAVTAPKAGLTRDEFAALLRSFQADVELGGGGLDMAFDAMAGSPGASFLSQEALVRWADHEGWFLL